jgi:hypothetical protein
MGVGGQHHAPAALPPGKTQYPLFTFLMFALHPTRVVWLDDDDDDDNNNNIIIIIIITILWSKSIWGSRCIAPNIFKVNSRWMWMVNFTTRPLYPGERFPSTQWVEVWLVLEVYIGTWSREPSASAGNWITISWYSRQWHGFSLSRRNKFRFLCQQLCLFCRLNLYLRFK